MRAALAAGLALALASGCAIEEDYGDTRFSCDDSSSCPDGFACVDSECVPDGSGDDAVPQSCGRASDFDDDFGDGIVADEWTASAPAGGFGGEPDGDAELALSADQAGEAHYMTRCTHDLSDDAVYIHVEQHAGGDAETFFEVAGDAGHVASVSYDGSQLTLRTKGDGKNNSVKLTFDDDWRWWRIEGADAEIHYHVGASEGDWEHLASHPLPANLLDARVSFGVRADAPVDAEAEFDDYNGG